MPFLLSLLYQKFWETTISKTPRATKNFFDGMRSEMEVELHKFTPGVPLIRIVLHRFLPWGSCCLPFQKETLRQMTLNSKRSFCSSSCSVQGVAVYSGILSQQWACTPVENPFRVFFHQRVAAFFHFVRSKSKTASLLIISFPTPLLSFIYKLKRSLGTNSNNLGQYSTKLAPKSSLICIILFVQLFPTLLGFKLG